MVVIANFVDSSNKRSGIVINCRNISFVWVGPLGRQKTANIGFLYASNESS